MASPFGIVTERQRVAITASVAPKYAVAGVPAGFFQEHFVLRETATADARLLCCGLHQHHTILVLVADFTGVPLPVDDLTDLTHKQLQREPNGHPVDLFRGLYQSIDAALGTPSAARRGNLMLLKVSTSIRRVTFATTNLPFLMVRNQRVKRITTKLAVRSRLSKSEVYQCRFKPGDVMYLYTDGLIEQVGGPAHQPLGQHNFEALLANNHGSHAAEQRRYLLETRKSWAGEDAPLKDVLAVGLRF
ncbi:MAG: SpoIIE family protein phosphatase [Catalinimonas sp.]